jgi:hypothetical protein
MMNLKGYGRGYGLSPGIFSEGLKKSTKILRIASLWAEI